MEVMVGLEDPPEGEVVVGAEGEVVVGVEVVEELCRSPVAPPLPAVAHPQQSNKSPLAHNTETKRTILAILFTALTGCE